MTSEVEREKKCKIRLTFRNVKIRTRIFVQRDSHRNCARCNKNNKKKGRGWMDWRGNELRAIFFCRNELVNKKKNANEKLF